MSLPMNPDQLLMAHEDRSVSVKNMCICLIVFSTLAVLLRFWSRSLLQASDKFWWDDWFAVATWVASTIQLGMTIWWTTFGLGKHYFVVPFPDIFKGLYGLFIGYFFFYFGVSFAKFSCLLYYLRVFNIHERTFKIAVWSLNGIVGAWLIFCVVSTIWQCTPIAKAWEPLLEGHCLNTYKWWSSSGISNIVIDILILILPLPKIWALKMDRKRIFLLLGVFVAGYCVVVISVGKTVTILKDNGSLVPDVTYNIVPSLYWLSAEAPVSLISICLPSIFALFKRGIEFGPHSLLSSRTTTKGSWSWSRSRSADKSSGNGSDGFARLGAKSNTDEEVGSVPGSRHGRSDINIQLETYDRA